MAINNPSVPNYKPFYIEKGETLYDTLTQWGFMAKANPYPALPNPKATYKNDWKDSNGDDDYTTHIYYESFTFDVQFYIRAVSDADGVAGDYIRAKMASFFSAVKDGEFKVFDAYTRLGRQKVRYAGFKENEWRERNGTARCIFTITFKVNDPTTMMKLNSDGTSIVAV